MKLIKLKDRKKYKYKRKIIIKNLILNIFVGIYEVEKKNKQRVRFNIEIITDPNMKPDNKDLSSIVDYNKIVNKIILLVENQHHELLEDLAENIFEKILKDNLVKKVKIKLEKIDILKDSESVGIEIEKSKV